MSQSNLMTSKEAAEYLGYSHQTMDLSRHRGTLAGTKAPEHIKIGRTIRYKREDLDNWVETNREAG